MSKLVRFTGATPQQESAVTGRGKRWWPGELRLVDDARARLLSGARGGWEIERDEDAPEEAAVSGDGIEHLRSAIAWPRYAAVLPSYSGTVTVTASQTSTTRTLVPTSDGTLLRESVYVRPSPTYRPRPGNTAYIECRAAHTTTSLAATAQITRARWRFFTDAPIFDIRMLGVSNSAYTLLVDGAVVSSQAAKPNDGANYFDRYDFSAETTSRRAKLVEIYGDASFYFAGACVAGTDSVWRAPVLPRMLVLGDSYTADSGSAYRGWSSVLARGLGVQEYRSGVGSTGYLSTAGGASLTFRGRLTADVSVYSPDIICIAGGINDIPGYSTNTWSMADLQAEAALLYAQTLAENPAALVIVFGPWRGSSGNAGSYTSPEMDTALQTAAQAQPEYMGRLLYVPTLNDPAGAWQFGDTSTGNFSVYGSGDGTHVIEAGGEYLGNRAVEGVRRVIETL